MSPAIDHGNFGEKLPVVYRWAYAYGVPGYEEDFVPQNQPPKQAPAKTGGGGVPDSSVQPAE